MRNSPHTIRDIASRAGAIFWWLLLAVWWGGLTFYAGVVVSIATNHIGSLAQGDITRDVTLVLNRLAIAVAAIATGRAVQQRQKTSGGIAIALVVTTAALVDWHRRLSDMLAAEPLSVPEQFYHNHAVYLWLTTVQWLVGLILIIRERMSPSSMNKGPSTSGRSLTAGPTP